MGSIRPSYIKNIAEEIMKTHSHMITTNFDTNKIILDEIADTSSKKLRNRIAGYLVILKKNEKRIIEPPKRERKHNERKRKK